MAAQDNLNDEQFQLAKIQSHPDFAKNLEAARDSWKQTGRKHGWYKEGDPLPIQAHASPDGRIHNAVSHLGLTKDLIIPTGVSFAKDEKWPSKCPNCDYFREQHEAKTGRPVVEGEEYPGWDRDWAHTHR